MCDRRDVGKESFLQHELQYRATKWILILPDDGCVSCCFVAAPAFPILECFPSLLLMMATIRYL